MSARKMTDNDHMFGALCDGFIIQIRKLEAENDALREQIEGHAERIAAQSGILSRAAEKPLTREQVEEAAVQLFQHDKYAEFGDLWLVIDGEQKGRAMSCTVVTDILWAALKGA